MRYWILANCLLVISVAAQAQQDQAELAKQLNNPVASLISVPIDYIVDGDFGPTGDGEATILKISPVLPFSIGDDWNLITRTSFTLQAESTRDLDNDESNTVAVFQVGQMFRIGSQIVQARIGVRHWLESPRFGADSTEFTARLTFLFPR